MNHKHVKNCWPSDYRRKNVQGTDQTRQEGDKTYQGYPGTDKGQAGTDKGQPETEQGQPGTEQGQPRTSGIIGKMPISVPTYLSKLFSLTKYYLR